jgi:hypothetical protein
MTKDELKWLTGKAPRDGRVIAQITAGGATSLFPAEVKQGQFYLGKIAAAGHVNVDGYAYLDESEPTPIGNPPIAVNNPPTETAPKLSIVSPPVASK